MDTATSTQFTPGPWTVAPSTDDRGMLSYLIDAPNVEIAGVSAVNRNGEANARLIAAAPELFEVLKALVAIGPESTMGDFKRAQKRARHAIDKAEGRDQ